MLLLQWFELIAMVFVYKVYPSAENISESLIIIIRSGIKSIIWLLTLILSYYVIGWSYCWSMIK